MKKLLFVIAIMLTVACANEVTGIESDTGTDSGTREILFIVTGSMSECLYVSYTDSDSSSVIISNCMVPFSVTVLMSEHGSASITAEKKSGTMTVMAFEDGESIGYDVALEHDDVAWWGEM